MLRAGGEHPIRLEAALGDQVVDENPDVGLVAPQLERRRAPRRARRVDARHESLGRRLFVAGRAVDLPGEKESRQRAWFPGDRVSSVGWMKSYSTAYPGRSSDRVFQSRKRMNELRLNVARQTHREAVDVDFPRLDPLGFQKNLVSTY